MNACAVEYCPDDLPTGAKQHGHHCTDTRHRQGLPAPERPVILHVLIKHRVNCGHRHQEPTIGAAELVGNAAGGAP
ncbi:hypothetical protein L917_04091 [Phytophthora nicotianae]|uniref:Uncharacterized protein n=1 Tax=Phytophthora nicotianae TaxID=4792 RepID=W2LN50_PHYNI|nr:hypothetical protein L917_04091 [Phytophthora nicotianae]